MNRKFLVAFAVAALTFSMSLPAEGTPKPDSQNVTVPIATALVIEALDCSNSGGNYITVGGSQSGLPAINGKVTFQSPSNKNDVSTTGTLVFGAGSPTTIDKMALGGGVGGNPWIYLAGDNGPQLLGRCVQGFKANWSQNSNVQIPVNTINTALSCAPKGSTLQVAGSNNPKVDKKLTFYFDSKAPDNPSSPRPHQNSKALPLTLTSNSGFGGADAKNGIGGNPDVYLKVSADTIPDNVTGNYLGRCKSLM